MLDSECRNEGEDFERYEFRLRIGQYRQHQHRSGRRENEADDETDESGEQTAARTQRAHDVAQERERRASADVPDGEGQRFEYDRAGKSQDRRDEDEAYGVVPATGASSGQPAISPSAALLSTLRHSVAHFMRAGLMPMPTLSSTV